MKEVLTGGMCEELHRDSQSFLVEGDRVVRV